MLDRVVKFNTLINDAEKETLIYRRFEVMQFFVVVWFKNVTHLSVIFPFVLPNQKQIFFLFEKKTYIPFLSLRELNHCLLCQPLNCSQIHFCCFRKHRSAEVFRCSSFSVGNWDNTCDRVIMASCKTEWMAFVRSDWFNDFENSDRQKCLAGCFFHQSVN